MITSSLSRYSAIKWFVRFVRQWAAVARFDATPLMLNIQLHTFGQQEVTQSNESHERYLVIIFVICYDVRPLYHRRAIMYHGLPLCLTLRMPMSKSKLGLGQELGLAPPTRDYAVPTFLLLLFLEFFCKYSPLSLVRSFTPWYVDL